MLSNKATPRYYGEFRRKVLSGAIPVNREVSMQMNLIDELIASPEYYYDDLAVEGFIKFCENELTLTDGTDLHLLDSFKLWAEDVYGWYYFVDRQVYVPDRNGGGETHGGSDRGTGSHYRTAGRCGLPVRARGTAGQLHYEAGGGGARLGPELCERRGPGKEHRRRPVRKL